MHIYTCVHFVMNIILFSGISQKEVNNMKVVFTTKIIIFYFDLLLILLFYSFWGEKCMNLPSALMSTCSSLLFKTLNFRDNIYKHIHLFFSYLNVPMESAK